MPRNADNEHHWHTIAQRYELEPGPINLENGYFGRMSRVVRAQRFEQFGEAVAVDFLHQCQQPAQLAVGETFTGKPVQVRARQFGSGRGAISGTFGK